MNKTTFTATAIIVLMLALAGTWIGVDITARKEKADLFTQLDPNDLPAPAAIMPPGFNAAGINTELEQFVKRGMKNPTSFEHVATSYQNAFPKGYYVTMDYRGTNSYGAVVTEHIRVKTNSSGELLEVLATW